MTQNTEMNKKVNPQTMLKKALASYDETINIMNKSSLDDENRKTLACAYLNRGDVLQTLEKWENETLEKAK